MNSVPVNPVDLLTNTSPRVPSTDLSNPDLTAEIGKTTTAGLVWNPLPRLSIALDGYHITVTDAVAQIAGSTAAYQQACYASGGTSPFCALQVRPNGFTDKSAANAVTRWYTKYQNIAEIETWGADLEVNYSATCSIVRPRCASWAPGSRTSTTANPAPRPPIRAGWPSARWAWRRGRRSAPDGPGPLPAGAAPDDRHHGALA
jgi:hypothetical protein